MNPIQMVDLRNQYTKIKTEIDEAIINCIESSAFIKGPQVREFSTNLAAYLNVAHVIPCANGTDALQIALMALGLKPGDEVIVPSFTYVAAAEVIALLNLVPVMVDVDPETFNINVDKIAQAISPKTRAIIPVHLFGQYADMDAIMKIAKEKNLHVIEDAAQVIGASHKSASGEIQRGCLGNVGCTSFFPSKNLGCFGDGGAVFTNDTVLAEKIQMIANHGQSKKYVHKYIGINSRLDTLQAAVLNVKLAHLDSYITARINAANYYDERLRNVPEISIPVRASYSTHVFHQYTIKIKGRKRDALKQYLERNGVPAMIYYPIPLNEQEAFKNIGKQVDELLVTKSLCDSVLSLPIHTELTHVQMDFINSQIETFFINN